MTLPSISDLYIYPVKSMAGVRLEKVELDSFGFRHDRRWMLVDEAGLPMTQRQTHRMALIRPTVTDFGLTFDAPEMPMLGVDTPSADSAQCTVQLWNDHVDALRTSEEASAWCSDFLGVSCQLVYLPEDLARSFRGNNAREDARAHVGDHALLLIGQGSLDDLNERLVEQGELRVSMDRFRPNLVVRGIGPFAEDEWRLIRIGGELGVNVRVTGSHEPSVAVTVDQYTAVAGEQPLRTLAAYRTQGSTITFGQHVMHDDAGRTVRVGDTVSVIRTQQAR